MRYIGRHAANENPPGAFEQIIGPPGFVTTTWEHADPEEEVDTIFFKTIQWWTRGLSAVAPSWPVPVALQRPRPSHSDSEVAM
eukprot:623646-Prymnesium_polylepis.1